jgi:MFS family permease
MKNPFPDVPKTIWALFAVRLVISAGNFIFPFLTLILTTRLGWPADKAGIFLTVMQAAALPGLILGGKLSDVVGRRKIIIACQAVAAGLFFACLVIGFSPIQPFLIAGASVALSMTWPVFSAFVADLVPPEKRKSAYALLYWGNNLGFSIGPLAAGFLLHRAPGLMFLGNASALCLSIFILLRFVPETQRLESTDTLKEEAAYRGNLWSVLKNRPCIIIFSVLVALMNFVYSQQGFSLPLFLNKAMGESGSEVFGAVMTANGLTVVLFTMLLSRLTAKIPVLVIMAIAAALYGLGFGLLALPAGFFLVMFSTLVWTWGEILAATNINVYVASKTPMSHRGRVNSFVSITTNLGSLSGPTLAGFIIRGSGIESVWPVVLFTGLGTAALMLGLAAYDRTLGPGERLS